MTTINLKTVIVPLSVLAGLTTTFLAWLLIDHFPTMGTIDPGIIQVIILAICVWLVILAIALSIIGKLQNLSESVKTLTSWQQQITYLALFAVLVLSGTGCLIAIC